MLGKLVSPRSASVCCGVEDDESVDGLVVVPSYYQSRVRTVVGTGNPSEHDDDGVRDGMTGDGHCDRCDCCDCYPIFYDDDGDAVDVVAASSNHHPEN